jgi:2-dehydro-3-deoxygluconokinase
MVHIAAIGEVMVELAPFPRTESGGRETMALSYAGDTYNTSVYLARLGLRTDYVTNLGDDPYSAQILTRMKNENIGTDMINRMAGRSPGLYIIRNTADGEREFFYWRKESPARELFSNEEATQRLNKQLENCDCVYLSGITLAIISEESRRLLLQSLDQLKSKGVKLAFDSNYRPRLWKSTDEARQATLAVLARTDIALLTLDDERLLWGDDSIAGCVARYKDFNIDELVLKRGADEAVIITASDEVRVPVPTVEDIIDTTGAGDTFNAGYLAARLSGKSIVDSLRGNCYSISRWCY